MRLVRLVHGQLDSAGPCSLTLSRSDRLPAWQSRLLKGCSEPAWATLTSCRDRQKSSHSSRTISHVYNLWTLAAILLGPVQKWHQTFFKYNFPSASTCIAQCVPPHYIWELLKKITLALIWMNTLFSEQRRTVTSGWKILIDVKWRKKPSTEDVNILFVMGSMEVNGDHAPASRVSEATAFSTLV